MTEKKQLPKYSSFQLGLGFAAALVMFTAIIEITRFLFQWGLGTL